MENDIPSGSIRKGGSNVPPIAIAGPTMDQYELFLPLLSPFLHGEENQDSAQSKIFIFPKLSENTKIPRIGSLDNSVFKLSEYR